MKTILLKENDYKVSDWSGGKTKELTIFPRERKYIDRDFLFRISSATVDLEESDFTKLPDYDRILMVLSGEVVLNYNGDKVVKLNELEQDSFDGAWKTKSYGKITDFNLMTRKGSEGHMDVIRPESEKKELNSVYAGEKTFKKMKETQVLFVKEGFVVVTLMGQPQMVQAGETLILEGDFGDEMKYYLMGEGVTIRCGICYEAHEDEVGPVLIPKEKASFDDFKCAFFLANTQVRGAKYVFKRINTTWYDEELQGKIDKLEKCFVTLIVFMIGCFFVIVPPLKNGTSETVALIRLFIWIIADITVVSPLIYLIALPKPVRKHIKDIDKLTPYEQRTREKQLKTNARVEKLMKKYRTPDER